MPTTVPSGARAAAALLWLVGCSSGGDPGGIAGGGDAGSQGGGAQRVLLGSGREAFEEVPTDGQVPLIMGLQGGFHVWTSFLAYGFTERVVRMELGTRWQGLDESVLEMDGNVSLRSVVDPAGGEALASLGWPASIFNPACADGQRLELTVTIRDEQGLSASDSREWIVDVAPEYRSSDCGP